MEILRSDWELYERFGQAYVTSAYPNVVKAWHMHKKQTDSLACIKGMVKLVLYDGRKDSRSKGELAKFFIGDKNPMLVKIPPRVWHGFKTISSQSAIILNLPNNLYNYETPDEHRLPPDTNEIPYDWKLASWLTHG